MAHTQIKSEMAHFLDFLNHSPTAWHAVANCAKHLSNHGFEELKESNCWHVEPGGRYYATRNGSSLCAFIVPLEKPQLAHILASHTDSPCFKLKPNVEFYKENMVMLGLETYGSPILSSWLNRDLGIAGRVVYLNKEKVIQEELVQIEDYPVVIPQIAIHLDRSVNETGTILNKQEHLAALAGLKKKGKSTFLQRALKHTQVQDLLSFDLFLYPLEKARLFGEEGELISSYRIDSLNSVHAATTAIGEVKKADKHLLKMMVFWDNEEIGSNTAQGAGSPFLPHIMERLLLALKASREDYLRLVSQSLCVSIDLAHAVHPSYPEKHEPRHLAYLNAGIVIKNNAHHRYATDARSSAHIVALCRKHEIPYQNYISRGDIPCGSTIGPIHANLMGMPTVDIGCPQLSMHSSREIMGAKDHHSLIKLLKHFLEK